MPIISQPKDPSISALDGIHLFHYSMSSCSQRVRFALEESNTTWQSHHIDLSKMEQTSIDYQKIHPKGYVPALVHDGKLVIESNDIVIYIDQTLRDGGEASVDDISQWLDISDENQACLKLLTYEIMFKSRGHFSNKQDVDHYLANQKNPELRQFLIEFVDGFSKERVQSNIDEVHDYLELLNNRLSCNQYLTGPQFSFADIANVVNVHRYKVCDLDLKKYVHVYRWYLMIKDRPAFNTSIVKWQL